MKKIIAALLTLIMVASLCACASDHSLKYTGVWEDGTTNAVLELQEEGVANLRLGAEVYELVWDAVNYDTVILSVEVPEGEQPQFEPGKMMPRTPAEEETPVEEETPDGEEDATVPEDEQAPTQGNANQTTTNSHRTKKIVLFKLILSIRGGKMSLFVDDVFKRGLFYCDFSSFMEDFEFTSVENEYIPEFSKKIKSIAFTKTA